MDRQKILNDVHKWFSRPGAVLAKHDHNLGGCNVLSGLPNCFYRNPENEYERCAIGCLIPDEFYREKFEGMDVNDLILESEELRIYFGLPDYDSEEFIGDIDFLVRIQSAHDKARNTSELLQGLCLIAADEGLTCP